MEESIVERVLILMKEFELTASEFADKIDVQRSSMSHLVSGRNKPSLDFIQKILNNFSDINPTWLIMGTGPMKQLDIFDTNGDVSPIQGISFNLTPTQKEIINEPTLEPLYRVPSTETPQSPDLRHLEPRIVKEESNQSPIAENPIKTSYFTEIDASESEAQMEYQKIAPKINTPIQKQTIEPPILQNIDEKEADSKSIQEKSVQNDKKVLKIVFFYSDNTFETFNPN